MRTWRPHVYARIARRQNVAPQVLQSAVAASDAVAAVDSRLPPVLTLRHLSYLTDVDYVLLRRIVSRKKADPYRAFRIRKRRLSQGKQRYRVICVPNPGLLRVQTWIAQKILAVAVPHSASVAYAKGSSIEKAAARHCGCRWLIKLDIQNFFESISEIS